MRHVHPDGPALLQALSAESHDCAYAGFRRLFFKAEARLHPGSRASQRQLFVQLWLRLHKKAAWETARSQLCRSISPSESRTLLPWKP